MIRIASLVVVIVLCMSACRMIGKSGSDDSGQTDWGPEITGPLFTFSPVATDTIHHVTGQGHLAPYPHTLPTPHVYLYWHIGGGAAPLIPVVAPGPGKISFVLRREDDKIMVRSSPTLTWYMDHIVLASGLELGSVITAGMTIGTTSSYSNAIDLGLLDSTVTNPFLAPQRYGDDLLHCVSPWSRYTQDLRDYFATMSDVVGSNKDGGVCFDIAGTVAGNWFLDGVPDTSAAYGDSDNWHKQLSFAHDETTPDRWRISVGGIIATPSIFAIPAVDPQPHTFTTGSGIHIIRVYSNLESDGMINLNGWVLVRLDSDNRMYVEFFSATDYPPSSPTDTPVTSFSGNEKLYRRIQGATN